MANQASGRPPLWWQDSDRGVASNALFQAELLGPICRCARASLNISQSELASAAGVSRRTIINVESGQITPDARTVTQIKNALISRGVSVDYHQKRVSVSVPVEIVSPKIEEYFASQPELNYVSKTDNLDDRSIESVEALDYYVQLLKQKLRSSKIKPDDEYRTTQLREAR